MIKREESINYFMNRGIIESNIEFFINSGSPLSIVKFGFNVDLENGYLFKDLISFIHTNTDFSSILNQSDDTFIIFLRNCKIHQAKTLIKALLQKIKYKFKIDIKDIGITLLDEDDSYKSLLDRLDKYYIMSKLSTRSKIFYGTLDFDYYETQSEKKVLANIFKKANNIKLYNFYQGFPVTETVDILSFDKGLIQVKVDRLKMAFYQKENFTFLQHDLVPTIIKASIVKIDMQRTLLVLGNLEFLDSSPVERENIRIKPHREIYASLSEKEARILDGYITSISENSIVLEVKSNLIEKITKKPIWGKDLTLQFQVPTKKSFLTMIKTQAVIYSIVNNSIVLNIMPNPLMKSKLKNYITNMQGEVIIKLKQDLKKQI